MGILVSPTFNEEGSEAGKTLGENVVLSARKQGLNLTMLESFGQENSVGKSNTANDMSQSADNREVDGNVLIDQDGEIVI